VCGKPKIGSGSILQKNEPSKNLTPVQTVFWQKLCAIRNSNYKNYFICICICR